MIVTQKKFSIVKIRRSTLTIVNEKKEKKRKLKNLKIGSTKVY